MSQAFDGAHAAYAAGDHARAKELSGEGKRMQGEMERLNGEAAEWIFGGACPCPLSSSLVHLTSWGRWCRGQQGTFCRVPKVFGGTANARACAYQDSQPGEVDLHGLYVKEAIAYTDRAIADAKARGDTEVKLIVGERLPAILYSFGERERREKKG